MRHRRKETHFHKSFPSSWQTLLAALITFLVCMLVIINISSRISGSLSGKKEEATAFMEGTQMADGQTGTGQKAEEESSKEEGEEKYQNAGQVPGAPGAPEITEDFLKPNKYSRSQKVLKKVKGIVVHYVQNPGSTAKENRDYFNSLGKTHTRKVSSHYIIGLEGEILQCIPLGEMAYASKDRNVDTVSIECCHETSSGKFNKKTRKSLVRLAEWLCRTYDLTEKQVIRHYDVTGKMCPLYYVEHPKAWKKLRKDIKKKIKNNREKYKDQPSEEPAGTEKKENGGQEKQTGTEEKKETDKTEKPAGTEEKKETDKTEKPAGNEEKKEIDKTEKPAG